jgi:hypothetical protein
MLISDEIFQSIMLGGRNPLSKVREIDRSCTVARNNYNLGGSFYNMIYYFVSLKNPYSYTSHSDTYDTY